MKKLVFLAVIGVIVVFGVYSLSQISKRVEQVNRDRLYGYGSIKNESSDDEIARQITNQQLRNYEGIKIKRFKCRIFIKTS